MDPSRTRDLHRPQRRSWSRDLYKPPQRRRRSCDHGRERLRRRSPSRRRDRERGARTRQDWRERDLLVPRDRVFGLPELADLIFSYLDPDSIKAAARVSR